MKSLAGLQLADILCRNWWVLLLRGLSAITFGFLALLLAKTSLAVLVWPFGAYAFLDGILGVAIAIGENTGHVYWWALFFRGLAGIVVGIMWSLARHALLPFLYYMAIWTIITGVLEITTANYLWRKLGGEWLLGLSGLASVVFGVLLVALRGTGMLVLSRLIAAYAVIFGVLLVMLAFRARRAPVPAA